jgi:putative PIN family toxin of toxin-antitoxin system
VYAVRVVADTNIVVSALFWYGPPRQVLDAARTGRLALFTSGALLAELVDVLNRTKFARRLAAAGVRADTLMLGFAALATVVQSAPVTPVIAADPDDDAVLACAVAAQAEAIVSGDAHLLQLGQYQNAPILTARQLLLNLGP